MKRCGQCKTAIYCDKECQKAHWTGGHKLVCAPPAAAAAPSPRPAAAAAAAALPPSQAEPRVSRLTPPGSGAAGSRPSSAMFGNMGMIGPGGAVMNPATPDRLAAKLAFDRGDLGESYARGKRAVQLAEETVAKTGFVGADILNGLQCLLDVELALGHHEDAFRHSLRYVEVRRAGEGRADPEGEHCHTVCSRN